jgi:hypothetical protein
MTSLPDPSQLKHIVRLLDDDTPVVREAVQEALRAYGDDLEKHLDALGTGLSSQQRRQISRLLAPAQRASADLMLAVSDQAPGQWLTELWPQWQHAETDMARLEYGLGILSGFISGSLKSESLGDALDGLALEFELSAFERTEVALADFLFREKKLRGVEAPRYYSPQNSDLAFVIESGEGIPISLCAIYMLVGARLDFDVQGCNLPRHFMTRIRASGQVLLVDCFHQGRRFTVDQLQQTSLGASVSESLILQQVDAGDVLSRVLRNLQIAYSFSGDTARSELMQRLATEMD